jgi:hypothetical protein
MLCISVKTVYKSHFGMDLILICVPVHRKREKGTEELVFISGKRMNAEQGARWSLCDQIILQSN